MNIKAIYIGRFILFVVATVGLLFWLAALPYPLDLLVGGVATTLAAVLVARRGAGRDLLFVVSIAAVYGVVEGVVR